MTYKQAKMNTFILSNMAPQYKIHNNGSWNNWENYTRYKAEEKHVLFVITGVTNGRNKFVLKYIMTYMYIGVILQNEGKSCNTKTLLTNF